MLRSAFASRALALGLLLVMLALRVWDPAPLEILRLKTFDLYQQLTEPKPQQSQVLVVDIDEKSLSELGQWPWSRTTLAQLLGEIAAGGAVVVTFDILFPEHDRTSPQTIARTVESYDPETARRLRQLKSNDEVLAEAMRKTRVVLGQSGFHKAIEGGRQDEVPGAPMAVMGPDPAPFLDSFPEIIRNVPELEAAAQGRGVVTIRPERDGIIRKLPLVVRIKGKLLPSLGLESLRVATGQQAMLIRTDEFGVESVVVAGVAIPVDRNAKAWLHFQPHDPSIFVSAADLLAKRIDNRIFNGKIVMIGTSATGLFDLKATPVDSAMPGVEAHAQAINAILSQSLLQRPTWTLGLEVTLTLLIGLLLTALLPRLGAAITVLVGAAIAASITASSWWAFARYGLILDYAFPLMTSFGVTMLLIVLGYLREELDRRQIRTAFGQYLSEDMVEQLAEDPERLKLGGETKQMTIMFSDVRGFTTISETYKSNPQGLTLLINSLLTPLSEAVVGNRGTIDKYMGDNIMAFWNAPLPDEDHALHACEAALEMESRLRQLNEERKARGEVPLEIGIGINTGECVVGNMGSDLRFDYTVLGDAVNLASRLEGQTKSYGVRILIGQHTAEGVAGKIAVLPVDSIMVKGKTEPEEVFTVVGGAELAGSESFKSLADQHAALYGAYRSGDWKSAAVHASDCLASGRELGLAAFYEGYRERIKAAASASRKKLSRAI
ncbi:MAG: adenylate/guanylate cyclase domain-containing protein [Anderseniella sp.]|nr:adenylate/guanylate cyclase domain-containing protein [Anderseniella sp.]